MGTTNTQTGNTVMSDETSLAVLTTEIRHVGDTVARIEKAQSENVTKTSWEQRNTYVDDKIRAIADIIEKKEKERDRDIANLWAELKSKKVSWTSVGAFIIAGVGLLLVLLPKLVS